MVFKEKLILIVDDHHDTLDIFSRVLKAGGYKTILAEKGQEALQKIEESRPDLIILDARLPDMSGMDICIKTKNNPSLKSIPIFIISASTDPAFKQRLLEICPDEVLTKPIYPPDLLTKVNNYLDRKISPPRETANF